MANNLFKSLFSDGDSDNQEEYYDEQAPVAQGDNKVVSMNSVRQRSSKIALYEPRLYADVKQIADQLLNDRAVIVNFSQMDAKVASRIVDFLNGTVFARLGKAWPLFERQKLAFCSAPQASRSPASPGMMTG